MVPDFPRTHRYWVDGEEVPLVDIPYKLRWRTSRGRPDSRWTVTTIDRIISFDITDGREGSVTKDPSEEFKLVSVSLGTES